jgi:hypothetical protein
VAAERSARESGERRKMNEREIKGDVGLTGPNSA